MAVNACLEKPLTLEEIQNVVDSIGNLAESTLDMHSLALVIGSSGEATFTQCGWKVLSEAGFGCPLTKVIVNGARNYTTSCGDDCKYFLFILKEMFSIIYAKVKGNTEAFMRIKFIHEISSLKHILPCVFNRIRKMSVVHVTNSDSFFSDLNNIVMTFMLCKFSANVSKQLASIICDFMTSVSCDMNSLKMVLDYVISHFDMFCTKVLTSLSESQVLKGFLFSKKYIPSNLNMDDSKFIIILDLSMKTEMKKVAWKISDELFVKQLNHQYIYQKVFEYFKEQNIKLLLTPSSCDSYMKLLCEKNNIVLFDLLDKEEIQHILNCYQLYPLENLNESLESKHIGELSSLKTFCINKSCFLHLMCSNSQRFLNLHHILLCAPIDTVWKEYYSECLSCLKLVRQWLSPNCYSSFHKTKNLVADISNSEEVMNNGDCNICSLLKTNFENISGKKNIPHADFKKFNQTFAISLPPCSWEFLFKTVLKSVSGKQDLPYKSVSDILCLVIMKCICKKTGVSFAAIEKFGSDYDELSKRTTVGNITCLEPIICKEIMIQSVLDLMLQLLKIDRIFSSK